MAKQKSFPYSADDRAQVLILGSMPGEESLRQRQYYAFPRNAFWRIAGELFGFDPALSYARRLAALRRARVALWDVVGELSVNEFRGDTEIQLLVRDARPAR